MDNNLYQKIINDIAKSVKRTINEAFDFGKVSGNNTKNDNIIKSVKKYKTETFRTLIKEHLIDGENNLPSKYQLTINPEMDEIVYDENTNTFYAFPLYMHGKFGVRKRKLVPNDYFYRYVVKINDDNTITFGVHSLYANTSRFLSFPRNIIEFISNSDLPFKNYYVYSISHRDLVVQKHAVATDCCIFFIGQMPKIQNNEFRKNPIPDSIKLSDDFVRNFPPELEIKGDDGPYRKPSSLYRGMFSSFDKFLHIARILVNNGYVIVDEDDNTYDAETIKNYNVDSPVESKDVDVSGKEQWLRDNIGDAYIDKFFRIREHIMETDPYSKRHLYLKKFNSGFRTNDARISIDTLNELAKANGIDNLQRLKDSKDSDDEYYVQTQDLIDRAMKKIGVQILYKMAQKLANDRPNGWSIDKPDADDFIRGITVQYSYYGVSTSLPDIKYLQLALDDIVSLYYMFYMFAYGVLNSVVPDVEAVVYEHAEYHKLTHHEAIKNINMDTFNFEPLIKVFRTIIDKYIKKYKLK